MQYRSQGRGEPPRKLARGLLRMRHDARASNGGGAPARPPARAVSEKTFGRGKAYGENDTDHQQQELLVMVAARLAAGEILRPAIRGGRQRPRRRVGAG